MFAHSKYWLLLRQSSHFLLIIYSYTNRCRDREPPRFQDKSFLLPLSHPAVVYSVAQCLLLKERTSVSLLEIPEPWVSCGSRYRRWLQWQELLLSGSLVLKVKKQEYESSWRIPSDLQLKPSWLCVSASTRTRVNPTQVCCGAERVCKFLPLVPSPLRTNAKWAKPDKNPAARSVLSVCHCCSSWGSSLWLQNFADFSVLLQLSLQS